MVMDMIYRHLITVFMIILFSLKLWCRKSFRDVETKFFWVTVVSCIVLVVEDSFETMTANYESLRFWRTLLSVIGYTFRSVAAVGLLLVVMPKKKQSPLVWIPCFITLLVSGTAFFTDIAFGFDENYAFYRGPLGLVAFAVPILYLVMILWTTRKFVIEEKGYERLVIPICALLCLASSLVDAYAGGIRLNEAIMISSISFYVFLYTHDNRRDSLTGLLNRQAFYEDSVVFAKDIKAVVSLDMNGLKEINDKQGHQAGDKALATIGLCIEQALGYDAQAYRVGGDEFLILVFHNSKDRIKKATDSIKESINNNGYFISVGYSLVEENEDLEETIKKSDKAMYEDKALFYKQRGNDRRSR